MIYNFGALSTRSGPLCGGGKVAYANSGEPPGALVLRSHALLQCLMNHLVQFGLRNVFLLHISIIFC